MDINIICIGRLKEKYWQDAAAEYIKRLSRFCRVRVIELKEVKLPANYGPSDEENVKLKEGDAILKSLPRNSYNISLDIYGREMDSLSLAEGLNNIFAKGISSINFIIGGSLGLYDSVLRFSDLRLSFSKLTFPHQMMRVILLEQIYRCFKINNNEVYHK